jgi:glycosyltransferase XagB
MIASFADYVSRAAAGDGRRAVRFACVGLVGVGVNSLVLWLLTEWAHVYYLISSVFATSAAILSNFVVNHVWTFADVHTSEPTLLRMAKFGAVSIGGLLLSVTALFCLTHFLGMPYLVANTGAIGAGVLWNYAGNRRWTWALESRLVSGHAVAGSTWHGLTVRHARRWLRRGTRNRSVLVSAVTGLACFWMLAHLVSALGWLNLVTLAVSVALSAQSLLSLYLMLYTWEHPARLAASGGPRSFMTPRLSFSVLLPARHEEAVIAATIRRVLEADYPADLLETVVICHADDRATIAEARRAIHELAADRARVETFSSGPINKPRALNIGLACTSNQVVTIFDAEDDIDTSIFDVVNTTMLRERVRVVQAGVQLMNFRDRWFSVHNVLEYFFWFKSRLHFHARVGMIPLGGNTVFISRDVLEQVGGWDDECLTEDADIGIRLSVLGEPIRVVYDSQHVTREETPLDVGALVRQRTRWHQGFLQVLAKGDWARVPGWRKRGLALLTLAQPILDAALFASLPFTIAATLVLGVPVPIAMLALLPLYAAILQLATSLAGTVIFLRTFHNRVSVLLIARMALTHFPYHWLLGVSAIRAVGRHIRGNRTWEKTRHTGAHRERATEGLREWASPRGTSPTPAALQSRSPDPPASRPRTSRPQPAGIDVAVWLGTAAVCLAGVAVAGTAAVAGVRIFALVNGAKR